MFYHIPIGFFFIIYGWGSKIFYFWLDCHFQFLFLLMATKFIFKCSITSQLVLFWLHSNFCFLIFHLLGKNKVAYWKSASLVAWKCLKSSCWGGGGWLPSHYQVKLQLMLRLSRAVNILNIVKIWGRFHCPCPWDACYQSVLATWQGILTGQNRGIAFQKPFVAVLSRWD